MAFMQWTQTRQRLTVAFILLAAVLAILGFTSVTGVAEAKSRSSIQTFVPYHAVDVYNETGKEYALVLRTRGTEPVEVLRMTVTPFASQPLYIHRVRLRCGTPLEVSLDNGRRFWPLSGNLCERSEAGEPQVLLVSFGKRPELLHVDTD